MGPVKGWSVLSGLVLATATPSVAIGQDGLFRALETPVPPQSDYSTLSGVAAIAPTDVWAVGRFQGRVQNQTEQYTLAMHYDGREWSQVDMPSPGRDYSGGVQCFLMDVDASSSDNVWAVGTHLHPAQAGTESLVLHWDGSQWQVIDSPEAPTGGTGSIFNAVQVLGDDDVWAVGTWAGQTNDGWAAHYDGSSWTTYDTPWSGTNGHHELRDLVVLADGTIWAAGGAGGWTGHGAGYVVRFDGSSWSHVPTPSFGITDYFESIHAFASDDVWACGVWNDSNNQPHPLMLHFDGSTWTRFDSPGYANALHGTESTDLSGVSGGTLVRWDGQQWDVDAQISGITLPILFDLDGLADGSLFAAGADGVATDRVPLAALRVPTDSLRLQIAPEVASEGDSVELRCVYGEARSRSMFALSAFDGIPLFIPILRQAFDDLNVSAWETSIPSGLAGHTLDVICFGETLEGRTVLSNAATLTLR